MISSIKISLAIPAYDRPEYLARLLVGVPESVSAHISDNASSLVGKIGKFSRNTHISHADNLIPMFANWNRALSLVGSDTTHVLIPSDDDLFDENAFARIEAVIAAHPNADIYIFGCDLVNENDVIRSGYVPSGLQSFPAGFGFFNFQYGVDARMPGVVFRKDFLDRIGGFDERFQLTAADSELVQRALILGRSLFVPEVVAFYRVWPGGLTHLRQATDEWMREIRLWVDKTSALMVATHGQGFGGFRPERFKGEIVARNLLSGIDGLLARGQVIEAAAFLRQQGVPPQISMRTRLRFWRRRLRMAMARLS